MGTERFCIATIAGYCQANNIERIDFLKIDVEGHELAVFKGMRRMLEQGRVDAVQFEYGGANLDARVYLCDIWNFLAPFGLRFFKIFPDGLQPVVQYRQSMETFKYGNYLAKRVPAS